MKRILINAITDERRVAVVDGQTLVDLDIEHPGREQKKANIYKARISRVEPSLEAVFVEYGAERHGFLPFKEIAPGYRNNNSDNMKDALRVGAELTVQMEKEERGKKGAAFTTYISLAGAFLVLMTNNPGAGGISRRIEGDDRADMREALSTLALPEGMGVIVRTAGVGRSAEELQWDLNVLLTLWESIKQANQARSAPFLIYQEGDAVTRAIRDHLRKDVEEILVDEPTVYEEVKTRIKLMRPDFSEQKIKLYQENTPLFSRFQIENQIETAFQSKVNLRSGGTIVIDHTEALVSIDINSGRATKGSDIEETALNTNLEASDEIARQLRLRDLGGLIVIDFIDMTSTRNQREVENRLRDALKMDRARIQVGRISPRFGLLEMSRQRLRPSLGEGNQTVCPRCDGQGSIRNVESLALSIMRVIEEDALKEKTAQVRAQLPVDVATYLLNEQRKRINYIEQYHKISVVIIPNIHVETPHYKITRLRTDELSEDTTNSYTLVENPQEQIAANAPSAALITEQPAVKHPPLSKIQPPAKKEKPGILSRLLNLFGADEPPEKAKEEKPRVTPSRNNEQRHRRAHHHSAQRERRPANGESQREGQREGQREQRELGAGGQRYRDKERRPTNNRSGNRNPNRRDFNKRDEARKETHENRPERAPSNTQPVTETLIEKPIAQKPVAAPVHQTTAVPPQPVNVERPSPVVATPVVKQATPVVTEETKSATPQNSIKGKRKTVRRFGNNASKRRGYLRTNNKPESSGAP